MRIGNYRMVIIESPGMAFVFIPFVIILLLCDRLYHSFNNPLYLYIVFITQNIIMSGTMFFFRVLSIHSEKLSFCHLAEVAKGLYIVLYHALNFAGSLCLILGAERRIEIISIMLVMVIVISACMFVALYASCVSVNQININNVAVLSNKDIYYVVIKTESKIIYIKCNEIIARRVVKFINVALESKVLGKILTEDDVKRIISSGNGVIDK